MKKIFVILIVFLVFASSAFAGGNKESVSTTSWGAISKFVYAFSSVFDFATTEICVAVTPFPSVLNAFTDVDTKETSFSVTGVLTNRKLSGINDSEYLLTSPNRQPFDSDSLNKIFNVKTDGTKILRTTEDENKIWGMVSYLFAIFTVLEVLYVTIRGYLVDEDNLVRKVVTRLLVTGILFLVLMALPALVELFRIGFFQMANVVSTPYVFTDMVDARSIFELPGGVLRCTSKILENMTPESMGWNLETKLGGGMTFPSNFGDWARDLLFKLLYFCLNVYVMVLSLLSAFQIMMNIVEVYILLAIVVCLVPFQVFTGTRYLVGENMIKSLFSNVIELFVIMVIIGASASVAFTVCEYGMLYLTNPEYFPVTITLDSSKLGEVASEAKFKESASDPKKGLSYTFHSVFDIDRTVTGGYIVAASEDKTGTMNEMKRYFKSQYYNDNSGTAEESLSKRLIPMENYISEMGIIPGEVFFSEGFKVSAVEGLTMTNLLQYIVDNDVLNFNGSSGSGASSGSNTIAAVNSIMKTTFYNYFLLKMVETQHYVPEDADESVYVANYIFWPGSVKTNISFDVDNMSWFAASVSGDRENISVKVPVEALKITFAGLLGKSVKGNYNGNKVIDDALEEYLNWALGTLKSASMWSKSTTWNDLSYYEKQTVLSFINESLGDTVSIGHDTTYLSSINLDTEATKPTFGLIIQHFFVCLLAAFMQLYFIKKSSSITNALQSGNASMDRTQAIERRIMAAAGFAAAAPVKATAGLIGAGAGALTKHAEDTRKAPLNDAR